MDAARQKLLADLAAFTVHADEGERAYVAALVALVSAQATCFSRTAFVPGHVTGSAFVIDPAGRLLLHHHRKLDRWLQLGGHDEGESDPERTAAREAREESGLVDLVLVRARTNCAIFDVDVHPIPAGREPAHFHHDVRYLFRTQRPGTFVREEAESKATAFFPLDEARALLGPSSARAVEKISRIARS